MVRRFLSWFFLIGSVACAEKEQAVGDEPRPVAPTAPLPSESASAVGECGRPAASIGTVQGRGAASTWIGAALTIEGVVVGDFRGEHRLGGFFVEARVADRDPETSDGLFVVEGAAPLSDVQEGDWVRVQGSVREREGQTELLAERAWVCGPSELPEPVALNIEAGEFESQEGRRVRLSGELWVTDSYDWERSGRLTLSAPGRVLEDARVRSLLVVDDGHSGPGLGVPPRLGDSIRGLTGLLAEDARGYVLEVTRPPAFVATNPRPAEPPSFDSELRLASFNLQNYFVTLGERGARTARDREVQRQKLVAALVGLDADVLALVEVENGSRGALDDLVVALNEAWGSPIYARVPGPDAVGSDAIRVGLLYRTGVLSLVPGSQLFDETAVHRRPPMAQGFAKGAERFAVVVAHAKSRSCQGARGGERDEGEGCFAAERARQSQALVAFVDEVEAAASTDRVVVVGDFNALPGEQSLAVLAGAGLSAELEARVSAQELYSYVFAGRAGLIDHAFITPGLSPCVTGAAVWHINADEGTGLGYSGSLTDPGPYRSSDHDPIVLGLSLGK